MPDRLASRHWHTEDSRRELRNYCQRALPGKNEVSLNIGEWVLHSRERGQREKRGSGQERRRDWRSANTIEHVEQISVGIQLGWTSDQRWSETVRRSFRRWWERSSPVDRRRDNAREMHRSRERTKSSRDERSIDWRETRLSTLLVQRWWSLVAREKRFRLDPSRRFRKRLRKLKKNRSVNSPLGSVPVRRRNLGNNTEGKETRHNSVTNEQTDQRQHRTRTPFEGFRIRKRCKMDVWAGNINGNNTEKEMHLDGEQRARALQTSHFRRAILKTQDVVQRIGREILRTHLFPSLPEDWMDALFAATTAVATAAVVAKGAPSGWTLLTALPPSPLWVESSESYSSSLLLDEVRK